MLCNHGAGCNNELNLFTGYPGNKATLEVDLILGRSQHWDQEEREDEHEDTVPGGGVGEPIGTSNVHHLDNEK